METFGEAIIQPTYIIVLGKPFEDCEQMIYRYNGFQILVCMKITWGIFKNASVADSVSLAGSGSCILSRSPGGPDAGGLGITS